MIWIISKEATDIPRIIESFTDRRRTVFIVRRHPFGIVVKDLIEQTETIGVFGREFAASLSEYSLGAFCRKLLTPFYSPC